MRWRVVGVVVGLLCLWLVVGGATGAVSQATRKNRAEARADAKHQLAELSLPPGASSVAGDPSSHQNLGCYGCTPSAASFDDRRFWRVPGAPKRVVSWVKAHAPPGAHIRFSGRTGAVGGTPGFLTVWFTLPSDRGHVVGRSLVVEVASARGGGSAVRADGLAAWVLARPRWDEVPVSTRRVTVWLHLGAARSRPVTITSPGKVARIMRLVDRAPVIQPYHVPPCPPPQPDESFRLAFRSRAGGPVLARAGVFPRCPIHLGLSVHGRRGPPLVDGALGGQGGLGGVLVRMGAVTHCTSHELALEANGVHHYGGYQSAALDIVDVSKNACEIDGLTTVKLLAQHDRKLSIPIAYGEPHRLWQVAPGHPVQLEISVYGTCKRNNVAAVRVSIAGLPFLETAMHDHFAPCQIGVDFTSLGY